MSTYVSDIDDENIYSSLSKVLSSRNLILFAGSGLSAQASSPDGKHPPLWKPLLEDMIAWCIRERLLEAATAAEIQNLIDGGFVIDAGQEMQEILDEPAQLQRCLEEVMLYDKARSGEVHRLITRLPFRGYLTTNYDEFIEGEFRSQNGVPLKKYYQPTLEGVLETYRNYEQFIVKLHGDINDPSSIILGNRSYETLLYTNHTYRQCLETIFAMSSILFVGFSGSDPDIEGITSRVAAFDGRSRRHYMLVTKGSMPSLKAKRFWKDKGINIIEYSHDEAHSGLVRFLSELSNRSRSDTQHEMQSTSDRAEKFTFLTRKLMRK
jgi:hypothetical protein